MKKPTWLIWALALGVVFFLAVLLVKPIGVSTQFSVLSGIFHSAPDESVITPNDPRSTGFSEPIPLMPPTTKSAAFHISDRYESVFSLGYAGLLIVGILLIVFALLLPAYSGER